MALQDVFLTPTGLLALLALVPLVVLYLLRPDPRELALPTAEFLVDDPEEQGSNPVFDRLVRNLLFLLQALVLLALAVSLASPYVTVEEGFSPKETVLVVDASASMATSSGGQSRLAAAKQAARDDAAGTTSVVVTGATTGTVLEAEGRAAAREAVGTIEGTDAPGDLRSAISQASSLAGEDGRVVVFSDFVDESGWRSAVVSARASGVGVELRQFDRGGADNVGFVDRSLSEQRVTLSLANTGTKPASREVRFAGERRTVELQPGDVASVSFELPRAVAGPDSSPATPSRSTIRSRSAHRTSRRSTCSC
ncbi:VWA domain-containing protein [Haloarculaceae archaeon H-GB2-1]|nr:VWA domain-containing protein [Haloarculaceae archaeon H-GB2-1]